MSVILLEFSLEKGNDENRMTKFEGMTNDKNPDSGSSSFVIHVRL
jgi:hypothetical protein